MYFIIKNGFFNLNKLTN